MPAKRTESCRCLQCGRSFLASPVEIRRGGAKYCQPSCWYAFVQDGSAARFWSKVKKTATCWLWMAGTSPAGYGRLGQGGQGSMLAHRYAYELTRGPIPKGLFVLHSCDTPPCVRPDHLFLGTHQDNMDDMNRKGRHSRVGLKGVMNPRSVLTEDDVRAIRELYRGRRGELTALSKRFGVSRPVIGAILKRQRWTHI